MADMILVIDNYDSFVFNIARYLAELGVEAEVVRNDRLSAGDALAMAPRAIVISPGPCSPGEAGISTELVGLCSGRIPILGVCLGHQCVGAAFGARIGRALHPMHGRSSCVRHEGDGLFAGLPSPLRVGRYHSLVVELAGDVESALRPTAWSQEGEIMAVAHREVATFGVQFHPESVLTEGGHKLIANFLRLAEAFWRDLA